MLIKMRRCLLFMALGSALLAGCAAPTADLPEPLAPTETSAAARPSATPVSTMAAEPTPTINIPLDQAPNPPAEIVPTLPPASGNPAGDVTSLPALSSYTWQLEASNLKYPLGIAQAGDGSGMLFIVSQSGVVYIYQNSQIRMTPFLDISDRVSGPTPGTYSERGLLGLAFHPHFAENGYFYVNYTDHQGNTVIARYQVSPDNERVDTFTEKRLLQVAQPYPNHNGGGLAFGPDGHLYIALGDGGSAGDPEGRAQSLQTSLGKILRIDVDQGDPYAIPPDNPFAKGGGLPEIWAYGLRNPWRIAFDPLVGRLYIADVGQNQWEEINVVEPGAAGGINFGWDYREGLHPYEGEAPTGEKLIDPVAEYSHSEGCSVTGGVVVRDPLLPDLQGVYLYGDYCNGTVWGLWQDATGAWQNQRLFETGASVAAFGTGEDGRVYLADLKGSVFSLRKK